MLKLSFLSSKVKNNLLKSFKFSIGNYTVISADTLETIVASGIKSFIYFIIGSELPFISFLTTIFFFFFNFKFIIIII